LPETLEHFIAGQPAASADGGTFEVADPVSNQPYATVAAGGAKDVDRAVTAASTAFADGPWPDLPARARAMILNRIADGIEARAARIAELETFDTGLPITQARGQAARAVRNVNVALLQKHEQTVPDIVRAAYVELVVTDLDEARRFWVDLLGFVVTSQSEDALYLRGYDELIHHNLILTAGAAPAAARLAFRVRTAADLDLAETFFAALGARTARVPAGVTPGVGEAVRAEDPLGFTVEFFFDAEYTERLQQRYDLRRGAEPAAGGKATRRGHRGRGRLYPVTPAAS
jgi:catechol 2,3-dioxygenase-like lactoylglutathione lyase family enzyme